MKDREIKELFGVSHSTLHDWINKPNHSKRDLGLFLKSLNYEETKKKIDELKNK